MNDHDIVVMEIMDYMRREYRLFCADEAECDNRRFDMFTYKFTDGFE